MRFDSEIRFQSCLSVEITPGSAKFPKSPKENFRDWWNTTFYRLDAFHVAQHTA